MKETLLKRTEYGANDDLDTVVIRLGDLRPRIPYQTALELSQSLRVGCKQAARFDRVNAKFWRDLISSDDPRLDTPKAHKGFRRSKLVPNVDTWEVKAQPCLVGVFFDGVGREMGYEDGVRFHLMIRKAGLRARAWAGDPSFSTRTLVMLTDAESDDKLGLM